ncbi:M48 family metalloprotease [bacterium]|nr:M48 family metalloprotease [bacterium]
MTPGHSPAAVWTEFEKRLGQLTLREMELRNGRVQDALLQDWVDRVAAPVAAQSTRQFTFEFVILGSYDNNAFSLPGGIVCVTRGLLCHVTSDEELAGVLAHEVAHAQDQDVRRMLQMQLAYLAAVGLLREHVGRDWIYVAQIVQLLDSLRSQRAHETQADLKGAELAFAAGYDPEGVATFLQQIPDASGLGGDLLATHPRASRRLRAVRRQIEQLEAPEYDRLVAVGDRLRDRLHYRRALAVYEQAARRQPDRAEAPARMADVRGRLAPDRDGAEVELALGPEESARLTATREELCRCEQDLIRAETRLRKQLRAYQKDRDIARALELSQVIVPEVGEVQYLATLARAHYALAASWNEIIRQAEILSRSMALRTGWDRSATDLQDPHKVKGATVANETEWRLAAAQFDGAVPAVAAATAAVTRTARTSADLTQATRMLALAFLALVASGSEQPLGRLNFTRFMVLQSDVFAADRLIQRAARAGREAHAEIVRQHLVALAEQMSVLHATAGPALRELDGGLVAQRLGGAQPPPVQTPQLLGQALLVCHAPPEATVESLQAVDTVLRMCYLDMRAERGQ